MRNVKMTSANLAGSGADDRRCPNFSNRLIQIQLAQLGWLKSLARKYSARPS
jgi:hypothetical protein